MAATFTISDAARRCGVTRRTLQRAIHTGRLTLTPEHRVTTTALAHAGYTPQAEPQRPVTATAPIQEVTQHLARVVERLDRLITLLEAQQDAATPQRHDTGTTQRQTAGTTQRPARRRRSDAPETAPAYDPARFVLGRLCPRRHAYGDTGLTLRRRHNKDCPTCGVEQRRARRQAQRAGG